MKFPNLRYGNPNELAAYVQGVPVKEIAKRLRRSERSIKNWLAGRERVPWWVPEIIRLQNMEHQERMRHMGIAPLRARLGLVDAEIISFPAPKQQAAADPAQEAAAVVGLRRFKQRGI